ncbi:MAG: SH3 domain-containing protein [Candidatus Hadarchaeum sp.]
MIRTLMILLLVSFLVMGLAAPASFAKPRQSELDAPVVQSVFARRGTVLAWRLNVRSGPGITHTKIGQLRRGQVIEILDIRNGWLRIRFPEAPQAEAWVSANYVKLEGQVSPPVQAVITTGSAARSPGKLVFQNHNGGDIFVINADGTGLRRLTGGFEPSLSPDGTQVAFTRFTAPMGLYLIDLDGSNERLVYGANRPRSPTWAPDGRAIVLERNSRSEDCRWLPTLGCVSEVQWNTLSNGAPCAKVGENQICYADFPKHTRYFSNITWIHLDKGEVRDLPAPEQCAAPVYHPFEEKVLFSAREGLYSVETVGNQGPRLLVNAPGLIGTGVFSPDGQYIYGMRWSGQYWQIWRWRADGSDGYALTEGKTSGNNVSPTVSPDGREVIFLTDRDGRWRLYIMNADGSHQRPFAPRVLDAVNFRYDYTSERMVSWGK